MIICMIMQKDSLLKEQFSVINCRGDLNERDYCDTKGLHVDVVHGHDFAHVLGAKIKEAVSSPNRDANFPSLIRIPIF